MNQPDREPEGARPGAEPAGDRRFRVFGLSMVLRILDPDTVPFQVQCPRGQPIQYGEVVSRGDGFDAHAQCFRRMPALGAVVAFEETAEGVEGHYFFVGDDEFRILHLDAVDIAFP